MKIEWLHQQDIDRQVWNDFIRASPMGALYGLGEYLDIIHPQWQALVVSEKDSWLAVMPWFPKSRLGIRQMVQPLLCQYQGIFWGTSPLDPYKQFEWKRKIVEQFAVYADEHCRQFHCNFSPLFDYPLPFHWQGFQLIPRFTYYLNLKAPLPPYSDRHQRSLKRCDSEGFAMKINQENSPFLEQLAGSFDKKGVRFKTPQFQAIERIMATFIPQKEVRLLECYNARGEWLSGMLLYAFNQTYTYYLGASSEAGRKSNAMTWLMHQAIQMAKNEGAQIFDFEGSMIQNVETFFRGFGATPRIFFEIKK